MIVTFISQCQKNSLKLTRQILDAYANRIGERTWQTVMTQEGLNAVKSRLAKTARKTTAVACHRMHGTSCTELVWIVGNKREFDFAGNVPVNRTQRDVLKEHWENDWHYLQLIKVLVALSALFHDFGKSWKPFQDLLAGKGQDPIRHEWISLLLFRAFVAGRTDEQWLDELIALGQADTKTRQACSQRLTKSPLPTQKEVLQPLKGLSPFSGWVGWLIVSHHRLPNLKETGFNASKHVSTLDIFRGVQLEPSGYLKHKNFKEADWKFTDNLLPIVSAPWCEAAGRWAESAKHVLNQYSAEQLQQVARSHLTLARLSLMLGDHHYSSMPAKPNWSDLKLYANTDKADEKGHKPLKQRLDEHLVNVAKEALRVARLLPSLETRLARVSNIRALRKPSPSTYQWQNKVVNAISAWKKDHDLKQSGFFALNMASTGTGKTFANAKIMYALSDDESLRYNLALGLRTLTLQTGDEYREKIFQNHLDGESELAVLIGSAAVQYLHERKREQDHQQTQLIGSESAQPIDEFFESIAGGTISDDSVLETLFSYRRDKPAINNKKRRFLDTPIVVSTIDHLMPATEGVRGGQQILPTLRLMSSDLVIDEVDDFNEQDFPAIVRLVHLVGMLGRRVMISSATIPPAIAQGLYQAYQAGWMIFALTRGRKATVSTLWVDEFKTSIKLLEGNNDFSLAHQQFIQERSKNLASLPAKRKADIKRFAPLAEGVDKVLGRNEYFGKLLEAAISLHRSHHLIDEASHKTMSLGVIRLANVDPCIGMARYLLNCALPDDIDIRVISYHARQVLLLRDQLETYLDSVLKRNDESKVFKNQIIRQHLNTSKKNHLMFIVVASPVEEVGRDHDFDWAVIEPSSMRSIIQMSGRVLRHRQKTIETPNIALPEYNLKSFFNPESLAFFHPGFESDKHPLAGSHSLSHVLDVRVLAEKIDSRPRIQANEPLQPSQRLDDLEHTVLNDLLLSESHLPDQCWGWLHSDYYLSLLPQRLTPFRKQSISESIYKLHLTDDDELEIRSPDKDGFGKVQAQHSIAFLTEAERQRVWLPLDYFDGIEKQLEQGTKKRRALCELLGEFRLPDNEGSTGFTLVFELGFLRMHLSGD